MKAIVCLPVDFAHNSLGLPALLGEEVDSASVLYHTVSRLTLTDDFEVVLLFAESQRAGKDVALAREMLSGLDCHYLTSSAADVVNREFLRRGRLWSLQAWRGGMGWTSYWDEAGRPAALLEAAERFDADAVGLITPESVYVDPKLTGEILAWHRDHLRSARVTVADVAVGLAPAFFQRDVLQGFAGEGLTFAAVMSYKPTHPQRDLATTDAHFEADMRLRLVPRRFTLHSLRQLELARELSRLGASPRAASALEVVETYRAHPELWPGAVPEKIEIEATSALDAAPFYLKSFLEHRRAAEMPIETFTEIVASIGPHRDLLLTLEGLGDPLLHPRAPQLVAAAKEAGFLGVHLATFGGRLDEELFRALQEARLDVLSVHVGASSEEGYERLFGSAGGGEGGGGGGGGLSRVTKALEAAFAMRKASSVPWPLVVAEMTKMRPLEADIEPFHERWLAGCDWPVIRPFNDRAGQIEDAATIHMRTSARGPCRKIFTEMYIDAEGIAWPCRQDIHRTCPLGSAAREGVGALWNSSFMGDLRAAQLAGDSDFFPLCAECKDWYYTI